MNIKVQLLTGDVSRGLVAEVELPPFQMMPAVTQWGSRTFVRVTKEKDDTCEKYAECFCYVVPDNAKVKRGE